VLLDHGDKSTPSSCAFLRRDAGYVLVLPEDELSKVLALELQDLLHGR
jgi:hypothetical protein